MNQIPPELRRIILSYCDNPTFYHLIQTSMKFHLYTKIDIWKRRYKNKFQDLYDGPKRISKRLADFLDVPYETKLTSWIIYQVVWDYIYKNNLMKSEQTTIFQLAVHDKIMVDSDIKLKRLLNRPPNTEINRIYFTQYLHAVQFSKN